MTEQEVLDNARVMAERLLPHGWDTVVVDIDWYDPTARSHGYNEDAPFTLDAFGRQLPAENRFPSSAGGRGFGPLADAVHALGLKLGVHVMRGIPRRAVDLDLPVAGTSWTARDAADTDSVCRWNPDNYGLAHDHPAAQAYLDGLVAQLAAWGIDYLKVDDMLAPYHPEAVEAWATAIARTGRDMVLSLSPGTHLSTAHVEHLREHAQLWRISDDLWDRWEDVHAQFARLARWAPFQRPGGWADADMLPLGRIGLRAERGEPRDSRLTLDEQRTLLTLWVMGRSPLMVGGDLPTSSPQTLDLLATPAVGHVLRTASEGREIAREPLDGGELIVWTARSDVDAGRYAAVFWTGDGPLHHALPLASLLGHADALTRRWTTRDLWSGATGPEPLTTVDEPGGLLTVDVPAHGVAWLRLDPA
ncbi:alpha-galactosidase [Cellulomonas soli]